MSTNYYWIVDPCPTCKNGIRVHVGKRSNQSFTFHGYRTHSLLGPVTSVTEWRRVMTGTRGILVDEYGAEVQSPEKWLQTIAPNEFPQPVRTLLAPVVQSTGIKFSFHDFE